MRENVCAISSAAVEMTTKSLSRWMNGKKAKDGTVAFVLPKRSNIRPTFVTILTRSLSSRTSIAFA